MSRYQRQIQLPELGEAGQQALGRATVLLIGCGALGSTSAAILARAGIGHLRLVDRDRVELINLHRQLLYDEQDAASGAPKAEIAARKLRAMNSEVKVEGLVADVDTENIRALLRGVDLVLDGTDNLETRFVINDACIQSQTPWVYGGVVGTSGMMLPIIPGSGPCLRCLLPDTQDLGESERFLGSNEWRDFGFEFEVPEACRMQEIRLESAGKRPVEHKIDGGAWFDRLAIRRVSAGRTSADGS